LSPVAYFDYPKVERQMRTVINNIRDNCSFLQSLDRDRVRDCAFYMLLTTAVSLKHEGFLEEKEWRIIYVPQLNPSTLISRSIEIIDGIPQVIHKISFEDSPPHNVVGITIPALIERVIIGPTAYPNPVYGAFVTALGDAGVINPESKVVFSGIPLRP